MANVNLISARRAERVRLSRIARGLIGGIGLTLIVGLASAGTMTLRIMLVKNELAGIQRELERLAPIRKEIETNDGERLALKPKLDTLNEARLRTHRWWDILEGLKRAVPEQTWLTGISMEGRAETGPTLRMTGTTVSQERVGETMLRLSEQSAYYSKVDLRYTQASQGLFGDVVEFELASVLQPFELQPGAENKGTGDEAKTN